MAVKAETENDVIKLTLDNGDRQKFLEVLDEWNFKDEESLLRFFISIAKESVDKRTIAYKDNTDSLNEVTPAQHLLKIEPIQNRTK